MTGHSVHCNIVHSGLYCHFLWELVLCLVFSYQRYSLVESGQGQWLSAWLFIGYFDSTPVASYDSLCYISLFPFHFVTCNKIFLLLTLLQIGFLYFWYLDRMYWILVVLSTWLGFRCTQVINFFVGLLFLRLLEQLGPQILYTNFAAFCSVAVFFVRRNVVETKGKSLQEIEIALSSA